MSPVEPRGLPIPEFDAERLLEVLARHRVEYVIVGALAAVIHGAPVMTQDLDVMPEPSRANGGRLAAALAELHAVPFDDPDRVDPRTGHVPEAPDFDYTADALARHDTWHLVTDAGLVDLTSSLSGIAGGYRLVVAGSERRRVFGIDVPVASLEDVITSKRAADRPKDRAALPALEETLRRLRREDVRERPSAGSGDGA